MNINEIRRKLKDACENTDCEKCVLYGQTCNRRGYFWEEADYMTDDRILDAYKTYFFLKDKGPRTLEESIRFFKEIGAIPENDGKDDASKPILSRVPSAGIYYIAEARAYGCKKYPEDSWKAIDAQRHFEAALRHIERMRNNYKAVNPESGLEHIKHALCDLAFVAAKMEEEK